MKWQSALLLLALAVSVLAPVSFAPVAGSRDLPALGTLDVCHAASPAVSAGGEMPCVMAHAQEQQPSYCIAYREEIKPLFIAFLMTSGTERPPAA